MPTIENDHEDRLWTSSNAASVVFVCLFVFFFKIKVMFLLKILLISDEPRVFLQGGGEPQVGEVTRLSISLILI